MFSSVINGSCSLYGRHVSTFMIFDFLDANLHFLHGSDTIPSLQHSTFFRVLHAFSFTLSRIDL